MELAAIQSGILAKHIFKTFENVFVENNVVYAVKHKTKTIIYEDMEEFNWFE